MVARSRETVVARGSETVMGKKATFVNVPGGPNQPPYAVTGKSLAKVANWILKGVQQAHHGHPELFPYFRAWVNLPDRVVVPQYQENADDAKFGVFKIGKEKREFCGACTISCS